MTEDLYKNLLNLKNSLIQDRLMTQLKVGLDAFPLINIDSGIGNYIFYLLDELIQLRPDCLFYLYAPSRKGNIQHFLKYPNVLLRDVSFLSFSHSLWRQTTLSFALFRDKLDFFWGTTQSIPLFKRKKLKTFFSLYDFVYLLLPKTMTLLFRLYYKWLMPWMLKKSNWIFPISYGTAKRLEELYKLKHTHVIHPPIRPIIQRKSKEEAAPKLSKHQLKYKKYILTAGTIEPRKNFLTLVEIYLNQLKNHSIDTLYSLVIIGSGGWKNKKILQFLKEAEQKYPTHIRYLGFVQDSELSYFLSGAKYFITLSLYEGYGMLVAESRVCGTEVVTTNIPELHEAAENEAIFLNPTEFNSKLEKLFKFNDENNSSMYKTNYLSSREKAKIISNILV